MSFPSPIESLNLRVTQGSTTFEQSIPSASVGSNTILVTDTNIINAFNNQPPGTIFNPSIVTTYDTGSLPSGDTLSTPSVSNFVPKPLVLSNFGPFSYDFVSGGSGTFILPEPSSNSTSPGAFTYSVVGSTGVVSISANVVTMLSAGTTTIRATQAAVGGYTSAYVEASVTVNPIAPTFSNGGVFTISSKNFGDASFTPDYPTSNSSGAFAYTSSAPSVATVHPTTGVVTIVSIGSTTIRATQAAAGGYTSAYVEASVTVAPIAPTFSNGGVFTISSKNFGDASFTPAYPTSNSSGAFAYTSSAPSVATVHPTTGVVTIVSVGTTTIRATQAVAGNYTSAYVEASVTVNPIAPTFSNGGVFTISSKNFGDASFTPDYPTSNSSGAFTYTSSVPSVASVHSTTGLVTIVSVGTTTIRATQAAAGNYTSAYVEASMTVNPIAPTFSNGGVFTISSKNFGDASFTPAYLTSNSSGAFAYTSSAPSIATVHPTTGVVTIVSVGTTTIRATQAAAGNYTSAYVEASMTVNPIAPTFSNGGVFTIANRDVGDDPFTPAYLTSNSSGAFTYTSSVPSVASVHSTTGLVTVVSVGTTTIRATQAAVGNYTSAYVETSFSVMTWSQRGLDIDGEGVSDNSGRSVSLSSSGDTLAIGAILNDGAGSNAGHARVYDWDTTVTPNKWTKRGLDIDGEAAGDYSGISVSLSSSGDTLAIGALYNDGAGSNVGNVCVYYWDTTVTPNKWTKRGLDIDGETAEDNFGVSVSLSSNGNTLAVGAMYNDGAVSNAGQARVYDWNTPTAPNMWTKRGSDIDGEGIHDNSGVSVSLSSDGNTVAVGARYNDSSFSNAGHVRVHDWNGSSWTKRGLDIDGEAESDNSGWSVSLSSDGNTVAIGARANDASGNLLLDAGHVRIYDWNVSEWIQRGQDIDGVKAGDNSGFSVSLSSNGNIVAIGGPYNDGSGNLLLDAGHARVYYWDTVNTPNKWTQRGSDIYGEAAGDYSGWSVSLSSDGNTVAIGATLNDGSFSNSGHVRVFKYE
jgi:uncharacterized protein YjdB